jgi:hypothetical protein
MMITINRTIYTHEKCDTYDNFGNYYAHDDIIMFDDFQYNTEDGEYDK